MFMIAMHYRDLDQIDKIQVSLALGAANHSGDNMLKVVLLLVQSFNEKKVKRPKDHQSQLPSHKENRKISITNMKHRF